MDENKPVQRGRSGAVRDVIAEAIRTAPTDSGGFDEWDVNTVRAVQADSILFALKEAGYVVVQDYPYRNLWTGEICDENSTQKHPTLSPPDPTAG